MPTWINPKSVTVVPRDNGGWPAAVAAGIVAVAVVSAFSAVIEDVLSWLLAAMGLLAVTAVAAGVWWRRREHAGIRTGIRVLQRSRADVLAANQLLTRPELAAPARQAIEQGRVIPGVVIESETEPMVRR